MTEADLAYAAGFIDADGSILIERSRNPRQIHGLRHNPRICASGIDRAPLDFLQSIFGGNICEQKHRNPDYRIKKRKRVYQWSLSGQKAIDVARMLMPYLRVKSLPAYLLSCYGYEAQWSKGGKPEDARMPDSEFERRELLTLEMRAANNRGELLKGLA